MLRYSFRDLKKNLKQDFSALKEIKVAVLADSATQLFCQSLRGYGYTVGINFQITEADYDQVYQTAVDEHSFLYTLKPDFVIVFESTKKLLGEFYKTAPELKASFATGKINFIKEVSDLITSRIISNIIWFNFPEINDAVFGHFANKHTSSFLYQVRLLNVLLMQEAATNKHLNILDLSSVQNTYGSKTISGEKFYITADNILEIDALPLISRNITDIILAYTGKFKKCLILDLDNTVWGGIIGDDGPEGIQIGDLGIGKAFTKFQHWVKQLKERGIILAVCSKNTESIAREPFEKHPEMVLKTDDIAVFVANWENKADNIRYIRSVLNIGFDSMVFLDDNPFEREMVKAAIPEICVPDLPEDPAEYLSYLYTQNLFETASFTEEDTKRNDQYRTEAGRVILQQSFTNENDFLISLNMIATMEPVNAFTLPRASQLTQRSNQFNLRTIRYSEEEMKAAVTSGKSVFTINLNDKLGDYGLISVVITEKINEDELFIDTWIMSCRVLKRGVEDFVLNELIHLCKESGFKKLSGEYLETPKNGLVKDHYDKLGFRKTGNRFVLNVSEYVHRENFIQAKKMI